MTKVVVQEKEVGADTISVGDWFKSRGELYLLVEIDTEKVAMVGANGEVYGGPHTVSDKYALSEDEFDDLCGIGSHSLTKINRVTINIE